MRMYIKLGQSRQMQGLVGSWTCALSSRIGGGFRRVALGQLEGQDTNLNTGHQLAGDAHVDFKLHLGKLSGVAAVGDEVDYKKTRPLVNPHVVAQALKMLQRRRVVAVKVLEISFIIPGVCRMYVHSARFATFEWVLGQCASKRNHVCFEEHRLFQLPNNGIRTDMVVVEPNIMTLARKRSQGTGSDLIVSRAKSAFDPGISVTVVSKICVARVAIARPIFSTTLDQAEAGGHTNVLKHRSSIPLHLTGVEQSAWAASATHKCISCLCIFLLQNITSAILNSHVHVRMRACTLTAHTRCCKTYHVVVVAVVVSFKMIHRCKVYLLPIPQVLMSPDIIPAPYSFTHRQHMQSERHCENIKAKDDTCSKQILAAQ